MTLSISNPSFGEYCSRTDANRQGNHKKQIFACIKQLSLKVTMQTNFLPKVVRKRSARVSDRIIGLVYLIMEPCWQVSIGFLTLSLYLIRLCIRFIVWIIVTHKKFSVQGHWKKSWHSCTTSTVIPPDQQQLRRPHQIRKKEGTCRNRFCWVRITQQHRVLTRNNSLRRRPSMDSRSSSASLSSPTSPVTTIHHHQQQQRRRYKTRRRSLHHLHFIEHYDDDDSTNHTRSSNSSIRDNNNNKNDIALLQSHSLFSSASPRHRHHGVEKETMASSSNSTSKKNTTTTHCCSCCCYSEKKKESPYDDHVELEERGEDGRPMVLQNAWTPPITAETLQELALDQIMNNIQLRHDLLFDRNLRFRPNFDGASGRAKQRKAERYWTRLDRAFQHEIHYDAFLPVLLDQVIESLALLYRSSKEITTHGFSSTTISRRGTMTTHPPLHKHQHVWPRHITMDTVRSMLNPDLILRELVHHTLDLGDKVQFIVSVLQPMCPPEHIPRIQLLVLYFEQKCYAKAFRQCFAVLEAIQLDQANRFLREHRNYLVQTCAQFEHQQFQQQIKDDHQWYLIEEWLSHSQDHPDWTFLRVYHTAMIRLITMDYAPFPYTLQYDQHRLVHQFRTEFIYITTLAILLIPYYYLVGPWWNKTDLQTLKLKLAQRLKRTGISITFQHPSSSSSNNATSSTITSSFYYPFAIHACEAAMTTHARRTTKYHSSSLKNHCKKGLLLDDPEKWVTWLKRHLNTSSEIYQMMHDRVFHVLRRVSQGQLQYHDFNHNTLMPLDRELLALGLRIRAVADLNLATYGTLYQQLWHRMTNNFKF
ncbi:T-complex protein 11-domain-containing protein [Phascolomyces articulosus]|uniref:T-complex protein 11-domain-containing protein n=1 Tax=Phascolomyces articulosus TaxID=60185 RepID=A0AAD5KD92_9FUNG|nr:T-complex protein 11-domain-containing protein [Phascolomyces articulosus]